MKAIIILSLSAIAQAAFSQQQQQIQNRNVLVNNISNVNFLNNSAVLSNIQINFNNNEQKQQVTRNVTRVSPVRRTTQVKTTATSTSPRPQVRRRSRPRTINTTPQVLSQPNVANVVQPNELINASNINAPAQNFILISNSDLQVQGFSNNNSDNGGNPFVQQEKNSNKESLQINTNLDLSINLKGASVVRSRASSSSSSSSHSKSHAFSKKMAKFKRNFFGKLASHKKGNHHIDLCFNWK